MARESTQTKISRVRPPRVQIEYSVHVGDAIELKEIPFVLGVLGDFTGKPADPDNVPKLKERKFVELNPDNFDQVLSKMKPHLAYAVDNKLSENPDAPKLKVDLTFTKLSDFDPDAVAGQIEPLKKLLELRGKLADLRGNLQSSQTLDDVLQEVINNSQKMQQLKQESGTDASGGQQ
jgi:type VI secretion system protein ImpB